MSAEVCRRAKLLGGNSTFACGWGAAGGGGGGWGRMEDGDDDCVGVVPEPMDPYGRRVLMDRFEGTGGL